ncbi:hypothetical protein JCM11251_003757 [Rhodosporidiobolus azoricus]
MGKIWGETGVSKVSAAVWIDAAWLVSGTAASALEVVADFPPLDLALKNLQFQLALRTLSALSTSSTSPATLLAPPAPSATPAPSAMPSPSLH